MRTFFTLGALLLLWSFVLSSAPALAQDDDPLAFALHGWRAPGGPCDATWEAAYKEAHGGRAPETQDCLDRVWSVQFFIDTGALPDQKIWENRFFQLHPPKDRETDEADSKRLDPIDLALREYRTEGGPCNLAWQEAFLAAQGRKADDRDCLARVWSLQFARQTGQPPTEEDWQRFALGR